MKNKKQNKQNSPTQKPIMKLSKQVLELEKRILSKLGSHRVSKTTTVPKQNQQAISSIPSEVARYSKAMGDPSAAIARGVYLPNTHAKRSLKQFAPARGSIAVPNGSTLYVIFAPSIAKNSISVMFVVQSVGTTLVNAAGQSFTSVAPPTNYATTDINGIDSLQARGSVAGLRMEYTGTELNRGGTFNVFQSTGNVPIFTYGTYRGFQEVTQSWNTVTSDLSAQQTLRRVNLTRKIPIEFNQHGRADLPFFGDTTRTYYPLNIPKISDDGSGSYLIANVTIGQMCESFAWYTATSDGVSFSYDYSTHVEYSAPFLDSQSSPSPAHVDEFTAVHAAVTVSQTQHSSDPHKSVKDHFKSTVLKELTGAGKKYGPQLLMAGLTML
jgi:hypothetical protein